MPLRPPPHMWYWGKSRDSLCLSSASCSSSLVRWQWQRQRIFVDYHCDLVPLIPPHQLIDLFPCRCPVWFCPRSTWVAHSDDYMPNCAFLPIKGAIFQLSKDQQVSRNSHLVSVCQLMTWRISRSRTMPFPSALFSENITPSSSLLCFIGYNDRFPLDV